MPKPSEMQGKNAKTCSRTCELAANCYLDQVLLRWPLHVFWRAQSPNRRHQTEHQVAFQPEPTSIHVVVSTEDKEMVITFFNVENLELNSLGDA